MNKKNTLKLYKDFPKLYKQHKLLPSQTCMCWGFDCGDGWFDLIYNLSKAISELEPNVQAVQVKEKFGGLRFYTDGTSEQVYKLINKIEAESYKICEECGTKENVSQNQKGWIKTLCNKCREKKDE